MGELNLWQGAGLHRRAPGLLRVHPGSSAESEENHKRRITKTTKMDVSTRARSGVRAHKAEQEEHTAALASALLCLNRWLTSVLRTIGELAL